jgi:uncharacterized membrane protein YtjA (UPF0391 family)
LRAELSNKIVATKQFPVVDCGRSRLKFWGCEFRQYLEKGEMQMLGWAILLLIIALVAGVLGFGGIAGAAAGIAKILFFVFLVLFVLSLIFGRRAV